ncbi:MAG: hypothetical protein V3T07_01225 [Myxococcota bacterium]
MTDASRAQGWAICIGAALLALLFTIGVLSGSYLALAIPVSAVVFFLLGLTAWVGYTIATIHVDLESESPAGGESESDLPAEGAASSSDRPA